MNAAVVKSNLTTELEQFAQNANCPDLKGQIMTDTGNVLYAEDSGEIENG